MGLHGRRVIIGLLKGKNRVVDFTMNLSMLCMNGMVKLWQLGFAGAATCGAHTQKMSRQLGPIQKPPIPPIIIILQFSRTIIS